MSGIIGSWSFANPPEITMKYLVICGEVVGKNLICASFNPNHTYHINDYLSSEAQGYLSGYGNVAFSLDLLFVYPLRIYTFIDFPYLRIRGILDT